MPVKLRADPDNHNHQLIMVGMLKMVEGDGLTPREVFEVMEDIKSIMWNALSQAKRGDRHGK